MPRPVTLFTGQWADLPFEEVCRLASGWGYDGLEIACWGDHLDVARAAEDESYVKERLALLEHDLARHLHFFYQCDQWQHELDVAAKRLPTRAIGLAVFPA